MRLLDLVRPNDLSKINALQLLARETVEGFCAGKHRSPHKGSSVEFKEHRQYVRGDELKNIDWQAYAKSDKLFIREFEEETNLRCMLLIDRSGSMRYSGDRAKTVSKESDSKGQGQAFAIESKYDYAQAVAAAIGYLALSQQDAVGVVSFDDRIRSMVPCKNRPSHLNSILASIAESATYRETDLGGALRKIAAKLGRRGIVVLVSDGMGDVESLSQAMEQLRAAKHEVLFFQILDPDEVDFPFEGRIQFRDLEDESNEHIVDARPLRDRYLKRYLDHQTALRAACRRSRVDHIVMQTNQPFLVTLQQYFTWRRGLR